MEGTQQIQKYLQHQKLLLEKLNHTNFCEFQKQVKKFKNKALYSDKTSIRNVEDVVETEDEAVVEAVES